MHIILFELKLDLLESNEKYFSQVKSRAGNWNETVSHHY